ncbi:uncharacterized protein LMH87_007555 [Akanthomyces muscarius]|uniref:C2H2-type domain-containing protein n=1 Tax=Akanthomyces muscarius TaxID=2231603 RepID=A0A9W8QMD8_AKAMU|nr:uncharacterized protein LMH87_007555 [Akanthomyces muscarius]KAJ4161518.1 hypothetical protein LMH87_007555 [Akanthomyces muscarius]
MHATPENTQALDRDNEAEEWSKFVNEMCEKCLFQRLFQHRQPPKECKCPMSGCEQYFAGPTAWEKWLRHRVAHLEKGEGNKLGVDNLLINNKVGQLDRKVAMPQLHYSNQAAMPQIYTQGSFVATAPAHPMPILSSPPENLHLSKASSPFMLPSLRRLYSPNRAE